MLPVIKTFKEDDFFDFEETDSKFSDLSLLNVYIFWFL